MPNFELMGKPVRFGRVVEDAEADEAPQPIISRAEQGRRFAMAREAKAILKELPKIGECLHVIMTGRYDLGDIIGVLLESYGKVEHLRIATLSYCDRNIDAIRKWQSSNLIGRISLLTSEFFAAHNRGPWKETRELFASHDWPIAASRSHCKVLCLDFGEQKLALEGSANMRTNSNWEQFALANNAGLHDWHAAWIDAQIEKYRIKPE
jgi:hypothetical protein